MLYRAVFAGFLLWVPLVSQTVTGTLEGFVRDSTGSSIPAAVIVAIDKETGFTRKSQANGEGFFQITFLPLGAYTVRADAKGRNVFCLNGTTSSRHKSETIFGQLLS